MDIDQSTKQYEELKNHIDQCDSCKKKLVESRKLHDFFDRLIPCIDADETIQESYENEIDEIIKDLMKKYREKKEFRIKQFKNFLTSILTSKNMVVFYIVVIFVSLASQIT
ncbi:MAG: hypothetical protein OXB84_06030 [Halobacteriovoraceae bacterium]|nr:hypothetical protein [Halobacteriovoraceae bacterium]